MLIVSTTEDNQVWVIMVSDHRIFVISHQSGAVIYNDHDVFQAINGNECMILVILEVDPYACLDFFRNKQEEPPWS